MSAPPALTGEMIRLDYVVADVFSSAPLEGNALAVFTGGAAGLDEARMQALARETNLSETVFLLEPQAGGDARCRIFTPAAELPFAGHPILGSAAVVARERGLDRVRLETERAVVEVDVARTTDRLLSGSMSQPIPSWQLYDRPESLLAALGVAASSLPIEVYDNGPRHVFVELPDAEAVAALSPDLDALASHAQVNCFAPLGGRWKLRNFSPGVGVPEDPATGSAAGPLAVHLARHGRVGWGEQVEIRQGAEVGRPSVLLATASGAPDAIERVEVAGDVVIVAEGVFTL